MCIRDRTYAKRQKDIDQMLERGELLTMEEFFEVWTEWKNTKYHTCLLYTSYLRNAG